MSLSLSLSLSLYLSIYVSLNWVIINFKRHLELNLTTSA